MPSTKKPQSAAYARWITFAIGQLILILTALPIAEAGRPDWQRDDNGLYGVQCFRNGSIYGALSHGASVYQCTIVARAVTGALDGAIEQGNVTLRISSTYCGKPAKQIVVPYSRVRPRFAVLDHSDIWEEAGIFDPQSQLCVVVVPQSYDRTAQIVPGVDSAVSDVFVAKGPIPEAFGFAERIGALEKMKVDKSRWLKGLQPAIADKDERVWRYAIDAMAGELIESSGVDVVSIFGAEVARAKQAGLPQSKTLRMIDALARAARDQMLEQKTRVAAVRVLASVAEDADDPETRATAFGELSMTIYWQPSETPTRVVIRGPGTRDLPFKASEALSPDEARRLGAVADEMAKDPALSDSVSVVRRWLQSDKK